MEALNWTPIDKTEAEHWLEAAARAGKPVDWKRYRQMGIDVKAVQTRLTSVAA